MRNGTSKADEGEMNGDTQKDEKEVWGWDGSSEKNGMFDGEMLSCLLKKRGQRERGEYHAIPLAWNLKK